MQEIIRSILRRDSMFMKFGGMSYYKYKIRKELLEEILAEISDGIE